MHQCKCQYDQETIPASFLLVLSRLSGFLAVQIVVYYKMYPDDNRQNKVLVSIPFCLYALIILTFLRTGFSALV